MEVGRILTWRKLGDLAKLEAMESMNCEQICYITAHYHTIKNITWFKVNDIFAAPVACYAAEIVQLPENTLKELKGLVEKGNMYYFGFKKFQKN